MAMSVTRNSTPVRQGLRWFRGSGLTSIPRLVTAQACGLWVLSLILALSVSPSVFGSDSLHAGFLFDEFDLTVAPGHRTEAAGPFFYSEQNETQRIWAVPPVLSFTRDPGTDSREIDFLYPLMTYDRFGDQYRWQFLQVWSFSGGPTQLESARDRFTLFPLYFQQRSSDPNENYTAVFPFYGHIKHRLFRDDTFIVMWPLYAQTHKRDVVTDNYLVPFFHLRHGEAEQVEPEPGAGAEHRLAVAAGEAGVDVALPGQPGVAEREGRDRRLLRRGAR